MQKSLQILVDEHSRILKVIEAMLKECDSLEREGEINKEFFNQTIDFIRGYADKFHHAKEEDILFLEFEKCVQKGNVHCNPVEQMLHEHNQGREFVKGMEQGLKEKDKKIIIENVQSYAQLLKDHIMKENEILYPMVDQALSEEEKNKILIKFTEADKKREKDIKRLLSFSDNL